MRDLTPPRNLTPEIALELLAWCKANGRRLYVNAGQIQIEEIETGWKKAYTLIGAIKLMHPAQPKIALVKPRLITRSPRKPSGIDPPEVRRAEYLRRARRAETA